MYHLDLKKQGDLRKSLVLVGVTSLLHVAQWVSREPPHHTLPVLWNLYGTWLQGTSCSDKLKFINVLKVVFHLTFQSWGIYSSKAWNYCEFRNFCMFNHKNFNVEGELKYEYHSVWNSEFPLG